MAKSDVVEDVSSEHEAASAAGRGETFVAVLERRLSRRGLLKTAAGVSALVVAGAGFRSSARAQDGTPVASPVASPMASPAASPVAALGFEPIALDTGENTIVSPGYQVTPLLRWGDPLVAGLGDFDPLNQSAEDQAQRFGYNCDWIGFLPLPEGSEASDHGLLVVNNEYTDAKLMFPDYLSPNPDYKPPASDDAAPEVPEFLTNPTQQTTDVLLAAHGLSIVEIRRNDAGRWESVLDSRYNRRITGTTPIEITGPAAGADLMKTAEDDTGRRVLGTLGNCAGGITPWGTVISGEENFQNYFGNFAKLAEDTPGYANHERFGVQEETSTYEFEKFYPRFDVSQEPNEPFRFGWGVEFDPYDPASTPKKRTLLGRNKHEGHTSAVAPDGQVAIYTGDDERFEYAYKFVSAGVFNPDDRAANMDLLDEGTLYVAKFNDDGTGEWMPLVYGEGPITEANGFASQADVLINTRFAADALGATKMDRPEDFETNPITGKVYLVCTNNSNRTLEETDRTNPRPDNVHGHIIEITEEGNDHAGTTFTWEMFILAGNPAQGGTYFAGYDTGLVSPISSPDNITFDRAGNIWISTDGLPNKLEGNDGLFVAPTEGDERGFLRQFFSSVPGAEVSGPEFNRDNTTLFTSIQHPAENSTFAEPSTRWPDGDAAMPPRPSVVVIQAEDGGPIGTARS